MITEKELREAIAECQGARNPNANTCIKLAAFYTILNNLYPQTEAPQYSFSGIPDTEPYVIEYGGQSDFADTIRGKDPDAVWAVMDEMMDAVSVLQPRLYDSCMQKLREAR